MFNDRTTAAIGACSWEDCAFTVLSTVVYTAVPGQAVIDVYESGKAAGKTPDAIKADMTAKIVDLGPMNVSHHAADPKLLNVFDVAPSSVADVDAFQNAAKADTRVSKFLTPPRASSFYLASC